MTHLICGLIGENIGKSRLSHALQIMCDDHGIDLTFTPIDTAGVEGFDLAETLDLLRADGWSGVTITHPWKTLAADWAGAAMVAGTGALGACNTLTFDPLAGHNTDYSGFIDAFPHVLQRPPGVVAVAGAGGVARAVVPALIALGAEEVLVWDKDPGRASALARDTGATAIALSEAPAAIARADGLANGTALGMWPDVRSAFDPALLGPQAWAFDAVYTPTDTPFLLAARAAGLSILTGFDLFRFMALQSFRAYTGIPPDPQATLKKLIPLRPQQET